MFCAVRKLLYAVDSRLCCCVCCGWHCQLISIQLISPLLISLTSFLTFPYLQLSHLILSFNFFPPTMTIFGLPTSLLLHLSWWCHVQLSSYRTHKRVSCSSIRGSLNSFSSEKMVGLGEKKNNPIKNWTIPASSSPVCDPNILRKLFSSSLSAIETQCFGWDENENEMAMKSRVNTRTEKREQKWNET